MDTSAGNSTLILTISLLDRLDDLQLQQAEHMRVLRLGVAVHTCCATGMGLIVLLV